MVLAIAEALAPAGQVPPAGLSHTRLAVGHGAGLGLSAGGVAAVLGIEFGPLGEGHVFPHAAALPHTV